MRDRIHASIRALPEGWRLATLTAFSLAVYTILRVIGTYDPDARALPMAVCLIAMVALIDHLRYMRRLDRESKPPEARVRKRKG